MMSRFHYWRSRGALLAAALCLTTGLHAETLSRISSRFLARGEQALLEVAVSDGQPVAAPVLPKIPGVDISPSGRGAQTKLLPGRRLEYCFEYLVSSYETGRHVFPSVEVMAGGLKHRTEPLEFVVFNPDDLQWTEATAGDTRVRCASAFRIMNPRPYLGETVPVEIKVFVPRELFVEDWGIPDFERDGVTAWRFQPSLMRSQLNLLGRPYVAVSYPSTLTPTRTGKLTIGPAKIRLMTTQVIMDRILKRVSEELHLTVPGLELEAQPLPQDAPEGFENAVGSFQLSVTTSLKDPQEGDPVPIDMVVSGSGNLDTLRPPKPLTSEGWKLYEATTEQRGDERRELAGRIIFHQFMRPLELKAAVPPFRLVYFDPKQAKFVTLVTDPVPLKMVPAKGSKTDVINPPEARALPVERMTDILALLRNTPLTRAVSSTLPAWTGHALAALLALALAAKALWRRLGHRLHRDPVRRARKQELRQLQRIPRGDDAAFLLAAGRHVERWHGGSSEPGLQAVLTERDARCFRNDTSTVEPLTPQRRSAILAALRKAALALTALVLLGTSAQPARAEDLAAKALAAYDAANYDEAARLWLQAAPYQDLSPDVLYNIGNACYRAGSPGYAALYYRRALDRDPGHHESRQNLRFIERKYGAITIHRPEYQYALARLPLHFWRGLLWTGLWLCALAVLVFPATATGARVRLLAVAALAVGPLIAAGGALGWHYFPDDAEFAPPARQAVIVKEKSVLHADAARTSPEIIDAPPGSLCEVITRSGRWAYVAFATKTRGWVPVEAIESVLPESTPKPPSIRQPKPDDKTA